MNKIEKFLKKLSKKERSDLEDCVNKITIGKTANLDIRKLKGRGDIFRVHNGSIRIIYQKRDGVVFLLTIERRSDNTYRDF